jgi:hypothetical protein
VFECLNSALLAFQYSPLIVLLRAMDSYNAQYWSQSGMCEAKLVNIMFSQAIWLAISSKCEADALRGTRAVAGRTCTSTSYGLVSGY